MSTIEITVSEDRSEQVRSPEGLRRCIEAAVAEFGPEGPRIITIDTPRGATVSFGLSADRGFVQLCGADGEPPYWVSVGDETALGHEAFMLHGSHHTEVAQRHLIAVELALEAAIEFLFSGTRSPSVKWEQG